MAKATSGLLEILYVSVSQTVGRAPLVGNRDVTGGARQTGGNFPFYALYGNVRSNLPESGARPRTRLESDCAVCVFNTSSQFHFCIHVYKLNV